MPCTRLSPPPLPLPAAAAVRRWLTAALLVATSAAQAQTPSIYTCTDAQGRRLTSDRPIAECMGREQRELTPQGNLRRIVPPVLTADERAREATRKQEESAQATRADEERRRSRALVTRYPNQATHDKAREEAIALIDDQIQASHKRQQELDKQHQAINDELEFYRQDPTKAPAKLKRQQDDNARQRAALQMQLDDQVRERQQIHQRYDEELQRLRQLWAQKSGN